VALAALAVVALVAGCGGSKSDEGSSAPPVEPTVGDQVTGGKALVFAATTGETLVGLGGRYAIELRGIESGSGSDFEKPDVLAESRCRVPPCEWTVAPETAGDYEFRAFLVEFQSDSRTPRWSRTTRTRPSRSGRSPSRRAGRTTPPARATRS
jgi:hypothetical protein